MLPFYVVLGLVVVGGLAYCAYLKINPGSSSCSNSVEPKTTTTSTTSTPSNSSSGDGDGAVLTTSTIGGGKKVNEVDSHSSSGGGD